MSGMFSKPKVPEPKPQVLPTPKPVRMPVDTDPAVQQAAQRQRAGALRRQGRLSTILTDQTRSTTQKLGS